MIHTIPYFDAHCDTIHRCHTAGTLFRDPELRAFYDIAGNLRRSGGHIDLERAGGFARYAQFFALYQNPRLVPKGSSMPEQGVLLHQRFLREMEENRERILPCRTGAEVDEAVGQGKAAALLSIEGAELLDCDIRRLDTAYDWGVRLLNPVWNYANRLSGSNAQQPEQGLTAYGRDFLQRMEELSIYVDVSHLSDAGFWDVVRLSRRPVVASHSNSRAVCPHRRNLTDDMFRAIRDSGGVAGLNYYQHFVGDDPTMEGLVRHVEHFLELDGEKSLCLGGDMDGCELLAGGMRGLEDVPLLWQALADHYAGEKLVHVAPEGSADAGSKLYGNARAGDNGLTLVAAGNDERFTITALFDNLGKGASGAAVQNMNIMLGFEETAGLL